MPGSSEPLLASHELIWLPSSSFAVVPPRVDYAMTPLGLTLEPVIRALAAWGEENVFCMSGKMEIGAIGSLDAPAPALQGH